MSYSIDYLIRTRGINFNQLLRSSYRADPSFLEDLQVRGEADLHDGMLPDDDTEFLVDLAGECTLLKLTCPYSRLISEAGELCKPDWLQKWELRLQLLIPKTEIYRIDDFLVDPWNSRYDYLLVRDATFVELFLEWLQTQDRRHWAKLNAGDPNSG